MNVLLRGDVENFSDKAIPKVTDELEIMLDSNKTIYSSHGPLKGLQVQRSQAEQISYRRLSELQRNTTKQQRYSMTLLILVVALGLTGKHSL